MPDQSQSVLSLTTRHWGCIAAPMLCALVISGCYTYVPLADGGGLAVSSEVRVRPTAEYRADLRPLLNFEPTTLRGRVLEMEEGGFRLEIVSAGIEYGARGSPLTQQVMVPWSDVLELEEKRFDRSRTALLGVTLTTLAGVAVVFMLGGKAGGTVEPPPNGADETIGVTRLRFP